MITQAEVKRLFDYRDGVLYWKVKSSKNILIGTSAGTVNNRGYMVTRINRKLYLNHRLIFLYHHGFMSENLIDHIDRDKFNNKIDNLREVNKQCNARNSNQFSHNTSGVKGVYFHKKANKWASCLTINQNSIHLGLYSDFTEAVAHRLAAEQCVNWNGCDSCSPAYLYTQNHLKRRFE